MVHMKTNRIFRTAAVFLCALLVTLCLLTGCATAAQPSLVSEAPVTIKLAGYTEPFEIHTQLQKNFLEASNVAFISKYVAGAYEKSYPQAVTLGWEPEKDAPSYRILVSENEDLSGYWVFTSTGTEAEVYNLKIGTKYYWRVYSLSASGAVTGMSETGSFTTDPTPPRNLYVDGITNVRDLGGWPTEDGGVIRQGLAYRTGRLNQNKTDTIEPIITDEGIAVMVGQLGVRTEIDLRELENNEVGSLTKKSVLGNRVNYVQCPMIGTANFIQPRSYESIGRALAIFADEKNYPIFFHCSIGTDRTGVIAFLILGLCGVSEDTLYRDYLFSNYGLINAVRIPANLRPYFDVINMYEGATLAERIRTFLRTECAVTDRQMDSIVRIMRADAQV